MPNPNISQVIFASTFSGLGQNQAVDFSVAVPSQVIAANGAVIYTASTAITNTGSIPQVQVRLTGLSTNWILLEGIYFYTDSTDFLISLRSYFTNGTLNVQAFILELPGTGITLPAFTITCRGFLYDAPF